MGIPLIQKIKVAKYILEQKIKGNKKYPLVLMLEPLFRCNLACAGCGKIDYPDEILNKRMSLKECLEAVDECDAPIVSIPGGEPLVHTEIGEIVQGIIDKGKFVYLCTNAILLEKKLDLFKPSQYLTFSIHLDGLKKEHDHSVCREGVYDKVIEAIKKAKQKGFRVNINCTLFHQMTPERTAKFFDFVTELGIDGITVSPGYAYERAPNQKNFLKRKKTKKLFRDIFKLGKGKKWVFSQSSLFLDFLAGNQNYKCTPWGNPTRNIFGWQKPCYLLGEGYVKTFDELINDTEWEKYGTGNYEKCANCMVHCGYEPTAAEDSIKNPLKTLKVALRGPKTDGDMIPDIPLNNQRSAKYIFEKQVKESLVKIREEKNQVEVAIK
jgi:hopanoid biosynthesis associated radical SAM protein HpnH